MPALRTPVCDLLGIDAPIVQSGMGGVAGPEMAAAVSEAGGLGVLAGLHLTADKLREGVRRMRELTSKPFAVNLWLHTQLRPPVSIDQVPEQDVEAVQGVLNRFRQRVGAPPKFGRPPQTPDLIDAAFEVILEERVPVWSIGLGDPGPEMVARCREAGVKVMAMAATVEDAEALDRSGCDVIVAQGGEAGGHRSTWVKRESAAHANVGSIALVPQVVDAVSAPVLAAGGIADGRGLIAALALGAQGVLLGTRFVATREAQAPAFWKEALTARGADATVVTDAFSGYYARALRNEYSEAYAKSGAPVLPSLHQSTAARDLYDASKAAGSGEHFPMWSGQSVGLIRDLPGAGEVVGAIMREAEAELARLRAL